MSRFLGAWLVLAGIAAALLVSATPSFSGSVAYVKWDSPADGPGNDWDHAYHSVRAGLNAATSGDEVWVADPKNPDGSDHPYYECITLTDGVAPYGGFAGVEAQRDERNWSTNITILDGNQGGSVVTSPRGATATTAIDGFVIENGSGTLGWGDYTYGGGVFCDSSSPTISNNVIAANTASNGGGVLSIVSSPTISGNIIAQNGGGGIACWWSSMAVLSNTITGNSGDGIDCLESSPAVSNNTTAQNGGGGIACWWSSMAVLSNTITEHDWGGLWFGEGHRGRSRTIRLRGTRAARA